MLAAQTWLLCFAVWLDNALVKTLSNFHGPEILKAGMGLMQKQRDNMASGRGTGLKYPCLAQMKDYYKTFRLIEWGRGKL
jgi:hypothetical protein